MSSQFLTDKDLLRFNAGQNFHLYEKLGAHPVENGVHFAVWAPNARRVTAIGEFNDWDNESHPLEPLGSSGVWAGIVHGAKTGQIYKYHVASNHNGYEVDN